MEKSLMKSVITGLLVILTSVVAIAAPSDTLTFLSSDMPPFGTLQDGKPVGFAVEILHEIMRRLGRADTIEFDDWKVVYERALAEPYTVLWPPSRTPEREELFKWVGPLIPEKIVLFARKDSGLAINSLEDAKRVGGIATVTGYASEKLLKEKGFSNLVSQRSPTQGPDALKFGRADLWINSNITMKQTALDANVDPDLFEPVFVVKEIPSYLAFSKSVPDEVVNRWQTSLDGMKRDGSWERIVSEWVPRELLRIGAPSVSFSEKERLWIAAHPTVKVVHFFHEPPFTIDVADSHTGYLYDLLFETLRRAGLRPEFVGGFPSYDSMVDALQNGTVDILTTMENTRLLPDNIVRTVPVVKTPYALVAKISSSVITRTADLFGRKVAVVKGYAQDQHLDKFPRIEKVHVKNNEEGFEAVRMGRAEYFLNNLANADYVIKKTFATDIRIAGSLSNVDFPYLTLSFGIHGKDSTLSGIINKTLADMPVHIISDLQSKWLPKEILELDSYIVRLTQGEKAFILSNPVIRVSNIVNYAPLSFVDDDGEAAGFAVDYIKLVAQKTGLNLEFTSDSFANLLQMVKQKKIDILSMANKTPSRESFLAYPQQPFLLHNPMVVFGLQGNPPIHGIDDLSGKKLAINRGWAQAKYILENHPEVEVVEVKNMAEGFQAVASNIADGYLTRLITGNYFKNQNLMTGIEPIGGLKGIPLLEGADAYFAVRKDWSHLTSIIEKGMQAVTRDDFKALLSRWGQPLLTLETLTAEEKQWISSHPTIRIVKSFHQPPFSINEPDLHTGYLYDLLFEALRMVGLKAKFVGDFSTYDSMINALQNGTADIMTNVNSIRQLPDNIVRTVPVVKTPYAVVAKISSPEISRTEDLFGKKVAVVKGYAQDQHLDKYPLIEKVHIRNNEEGFEAVRMGRAEYFLNNLANTDYVLKKTFATDLRIAGMLSYSDFPPLGLSFGIHGKDSPLPGIINKALEDIPVKSLAELQDKWLPKEYAPMDSDRIILTPEEEAFVKAHPVIRVHNEQNWAPFNFNENGAATGLSIDYMNLLAEKIGLHVEYTSGPSWNEFMAMIKEHRLDVMLNIVKTDEREKFIHFTKKPYIETPRAMVVRKGDTTVQNFSDLYGRTVAVENGFFYENYLKKNHPEIKIMTVKDTAETLRVVANGDAVATLGVIAVEQFLINKHFFSNLKLVLDPKAKALRSFDLSIGVRNDWPLLTAMLDKAMAAVTNNERVMLSRKWIGQQDGDTVRVNLSQEERAFLRDHPVIRISNEMDYRPFDFVKDGKPKGYSIDYMNLLAERLGIRLEYVNGYPWNELLSMFERRDLDLIHSAMETEDRLRYTIFTQSYVRLLHALVTRKSVNNLKTLDDLKGKTLAMMKGWATNEFILPRYPEIKILWVDNTLEGLKAVAAGQADAVIDAQSVVSYLIKEYFLTNLNIANRLEFWRGDEQEFRVGVRSDWPILKTILEKAMDTVTQSEEVALRVRWFGLDPAASGMTEVFLTKEEKDYLNNHPVLRVAFDVDWPPVEFSDKNLGMKGMAADYLIRMSELLGIELEPSRPRPWKEMMQAVENGELDLLSAITPTPQRLEWMDFTESYLSFAAVILTGKEVPYIGSMSDLRNKPVAVVDGYASHDLLLKNHPNLTLLLVRDVKEGLMAVSTGKAFAFVGSLAAASHVMSREGLTDLKVSGETPYSYDLAMGTRKENTILVNILDKALAAISTQERNAINSRWTSVTFEHAIDYSLIWRIIAGALFIVLLILYWNGRLQREIAERKLAENAAEKANRAKSEFLANMSHELRTPLNAILGFAQIMERNPDISSEKENLKIIQRSGSHLLTLINQVLDLSKIEAGHITTEEHGFDLLHLLDELENMLSLKADKKHLTLLFNCSPEVPRYICTDEVKLRQVLINLLSNAIKFTDKGSVILRISLKNYRDPENKEKSTDSSFPLSPNDKCMILFEIEDTGPGIASEEMGHLFEAFGQTASGREAQEGTGLGLAISHKFIQLMGGDMHVKSELRQGTTFSFDIQVQVVDANVMIQRSPTRRVIALEPGQSRYRLLIVDDKWDNRQLLIKLLQPFGFDLREAVNGQEAVDIWETWKPHLIWMDLRMPVMDGYEATKKIREQVSHMPQTVIIAVTANVLEEGKAEVMSSGCDDIVIKPFRETSIIEMLQKHLNVKFVYEASEVQIEKTNLKRVELELTLADFDALPKEMVMKFKESVAALEMDTALNVIEEIREQDQPLADALQKLVEEYRFDKLQKILDQS